MQPAATNDAPLDTEFVSISIIPGYSIRSAYQNDEVNELSGKIIRIALYLFSFQLLIVLLEIVVFMSIESLIIGIIQIAFYKIISCNGDKNYLICLIFSYSGRGL